MRKTVFPILVLSVLIHFSCSKDFDSINDPIQADISGTWEGAAYTVEGRTTYISIEENWFYEFTSIAGVLDFSMIFSDNPATFNLFGFYYMSHLITTDEGEQYGYLDYNTFGSAGNWDMTGNVITLLEDGVERQASITELTEHRLVIKIYSTSTSEVDPENLGTTKTTQTETYTFSR